MGALINFQSSITVAATYPSCAFKNIIPANGLKIDAYVKLYLELQRLLAYTKM